MADACPTKQADAQQRNKKLQQLVPTIFGMSRIKGRSTKPECLCVDFHMPMDSVKNYDKSLPGSPLN